jgi:hypothetical protein
MLRNANTAQDVVLQPVETILEYFPQNSVAYADTIYL